MLFTSAQLKADDLSLGANPDLGAAVVALRNMPKITLAAQDIPWPIIRDILMNNWDWGTLVACTMSPGASVFAPGGALVTSAIKAAADAIREGCLYGGILRASDDVVWGKLVATAGVLTPATVKGISNSSVLAVTAWRTPSIIKWPDVTTGDVQTARSQP